MTGAAVASIRSSTEGGRIRSRRFMANRAGSTIEEINASHVSMISHPDVATALIEKAAKATS